VPELGAQAVSGIRDTVPLTFADRVRGLVGCLAMRVEKSGRLSG
jgi:hypothetical protein